MKAALATPRRRAQRETVVAEGASGEQATVDELLSSLAAEAVEEDAGERSQEVTSGRGSDPDLDADAQR